MKNIKNVKYLDKLKGLGYPLKEMLIVGSGTMSLYGLKENADLDLWVTKRVYDKMLKDSRFSSNGKMLETKDKLIEADHRFICVKQTVEEFLQRAVAINGFYFMSLPDVLDWKKCMNRPKDKEHIKIIEKYMKTNLVENYLLEIQKPKKYNLIIQKNNLAAPIFKRRPRLAKDLYGKFCENKPCSLITYSWVHNDECIGAMVIIESPPLKQTKNYKVDVMIVFLHIDADHRGNNLGGQLVKDIIKKYKRIFLTTDSNTSDLAKQLYAKYGFRIIEKETKKLWHWVKGV
jgi:ribosomal protein S18 acetylase RimI-like enzyme